MGFELNMKQIVFGRVTYFAQLCYSKIRYYIQIKYYSIFFFVLITSVLKGGRRKKAKGDLAWPHYMDSLWECKNFETYRPVTQTCLKTFWDKTGVINNQLDPAVIFRLILKFWDDRCTDGHTNGQKDVLMGRRITCVKIVLTASLVDQLLSVSISTKLSL